MALESVLWSSKAGFWLDVYLGVDIRIITDWVERGKGEKDGYAES
jgi:hypothetical protein